MIRTMLVTNKLRLLKYDLLNTNNKLALLRYYVHNTIKKLILIKIIFAQYC